PEQLRHLVAEDREQADGADRDELLLTPDTPLRQRCCGRAAHAPAAVAPDGAAGIGCESSLADADRGLGAAGTAGVVPSPKLYEETVKVAFTCGNIRLPWSK